MEPQSIHCRFQILMYVSVRIYPYGSQFILLPRIIVHNHDKIISNVTLLVAAALVTFPVWHQRGYVENSCRHTITIKPSKKTINTSS